MGLTPSPGGARGGAARAPVLCISELVPFCSHSGPVKLVTGPRSALTVSASQGEGRHPETRGQRGKVPSGPRALQRHKDTPCPYSRLTGSTFFW